MTLNDYQAQAKKTAIYPQGQALEYLALGLASEAGEVAGKVKKLIRDETDGYEAIEVQRFIADELGDVLWYVAALAGQFGFTFEEVAERNLEKLFGRQERGALQGSGDQR